MHTPKLVLRRLVAIGFVGLALVFAAVLIKAGQPSAAVQNARTVTVEVPVLQPGQLVQIDVQGKPLFLLKPDAAQTASLRALDAHVWGQESANWVEELQAFAYWGISTKWGCPLQEMREGKRDTCFGSNLVGRLLGSALRSQL